MEKTVLHSLNSGLVLDRSVFVAMPAMDMEQIIHNIRAAGGKPLYLVDGAEAFFTTDNLIKLITAKDKRYMVVNEALGGFFTEQQIAALVHNAPIMGEKQLLNVLAPAGGVIKPAAVADDGGLIVNMGGANAPANGYVFAAVPPGWSISNNMSLGTTRIKRKIKNSDGDGTMFYLSPKDYEKLWIFASKAWNGGNVLSMKIATGMGQKQATIQDDRISLGGNYIRRYEIEQVAKYRGWALPQLLAA